MSTRLLKPLMHGVLPLLTALAITLFATQIVHAQSPDIVLGSQTSQVCINDGATNFTCSAVSTPTATTRSTAKGDFDGDTYLDVIFGNGGVGGPNQANRLCLNDGNGTFTCSDISANADNTTETAVGDLDGDNDLDVVFANYGGPQLNRLCLNDGAGNFTCSTLNPLDAFSSTGVDIGDLDGDTYPDVIFSNSSQNVNICLNDGSASFTCSTFTPGGQLEDVNLGDVDGDNHLDAVFASFPRSKVCINDGTAIFTCSDVENFTTGNVDLGDLDGDTDLDAIFSVTGGASRLCLNNGGGTFTCSDLGTPPFGNVTIADIDGDTDLDAVMTFNRLCINDGDANFACSSVGFGNRHAAVVGEFGAPPPQNVIAPVPAASLYWPLDVATINIDLTDASNILGVGGKLAYDDTRMTYDVASLAAGAFLDDASTILFEDAATVPLAAVSVTRTSGNGATGSGTAAAVTLTVIDQAPTGTATFSLSDLLAVDPAGNPITLTPTDGSFEVGGVWPGDTDNNCTVEALDLLPIGLNFGHTGPARSGGFDISWSAKAFSPWGGASTAPEFAESFVDATGDGTINQNDILPIGVNFAETHAETTGCDDGVPKHLAALNLAIDPQPVGTVITVGLDLVEQTAGLVGTAMKLSVDPSVLKVSAVTAGDFLDDGDLLKLVRLNDETGLGEAAFTRKGTDRATDGSGALAVITLEVVGTMAGVSEMALSEVKLSTATAGIYEASQASVALRTAVATATEDASEVPTVFTLHGAYPNPFNPTTTVSFDLPESAQVTLVVFDMLGREVSRLLMGEVAAGSRQTLRYEAQGLASGTYVYRLEAKTASDLSVQMGRFVLLK